MNQDFSKVVFPTVTGSGQLVKPCFADTKINSELHITTGKACSHKDEKKNWLSDFIPLAKLTPWKQDSIKAEAIAIPCINYCNSTCQETSTSKNQSKSLNIHYTEGEQIISAMFIYFTTSVI